MLPTVYLKQGEKAHITGGFPWVYDGEVGEVKGDPGPGSLVRVASSRGGRLGEGFYSPRSRMRVRLLTHSPGEAIEDDAGAAQVIKGRLEAAVSLRHALGCADSCRLVFGESDGLPGLSVDRYGDTLVIQIAFEGMERLRGPVVEMLSALIPSIRTVVERSDTGSREREGLSPRRGVVSGELPAGGRIPFELGDMKLFADVLEGQKTGFYLDQSDNWRALRALAAGRRVLDLCCYSGAFGLSMLKGGAASLLGVDTSRRALETAAMISEANGMAGSARFEIGDAGAVLPRLAENGEKFGFVILDPSAFAKSRSHANMARKAYAALNAAAVRVAAPGCLLFTCSCTPWVEAGELVRAVGAAAWAAGRELRLLEMRGQSRDHPIHPLISATRYLSCALCHVS